MRVENYTKENLIISDNLGTKIKILGRILDDGNTIIIYHCFATGENYIEMLKSFYGGKILSLPYPELVKIEDDALWIRYLEEARKEGILL